MSNTIIMYENGKAVGGEGHPTNADEITFNNDGTNLVSEEVESAIKEVNAKFDRGSVSVTANGVKTSAQLLNELFNEMNTDKITPHSVLRIAREYAKLSSVSNNEYSFTSNTVGAAIYINTFKIANNNSSVKSAGIAANVITINDTSTYVPTSGDVYTLYY